MNHEIFITRSNFSQRLRTPSTAKPAEKWIICYLTDIRGARDVGIPRSPLPLLIDTRPDKAAKGDDRGHCQRRWKLEQNKVCSKRAADSAVNDFEVPKCYCVTRRSVHGAMRAVKGCLAILHKYLQRQSIQSKFPNIPTFSHH